MNTRFKMLAVAATLAFSPVMMATAAQAQSVIATTKIAVVDVQAVMRDSTAAKSVREQLEAKHKAYQAEITKQEQSLQKQDQELAEKRSALSKDAFEAKVKDLREKVAAAQKDSQTKRLILANASEGAQTTIHAKVTEIISGMAASKGFMVVLPTSQILYANQGMNITSEVVSELNKSLPKIAVQFKAPSN